ncbi:MAG: hydrogenase maturation protease [Bryobacteraceae bacterium]
MNARVLIAGVGNIFQGDDAFGVSVVQHLAAIGLPTSVRLMDIGIRSIDLGFALADDYDLTILVDATARGGEPGTLYTISIEPEDIPDVADETSMINSHGLDPVRVLSLAKSMGAKFKRVLLVGCEPMVLDHEESGYIGLSNVVQAAVTPAVETIRYLVEDYTGSEPSFDVLREKEVDCREHV